MPIDYLHKKYAIIRLAGYVQALFMTSTPVQAAGQGQKAFVAAVQSSTISLEPECAQGAELKLDPWAHAHLKIHAHLQIRFRGYFDTVSTQHFIPFMPRLYSFRLI